MPNTLYMVVEHFKNKDAAAVYRRFRDNGRMAPEGLTYVSNWVDDQFERCSRAELVAHPKVQALYEGIVEEVNQNLARFEKLKHVLLVPEEFSADNGALTPTLKLRRRIIEERYRKQIDELYAQTEASALP
jgi:long-subunit acyl-CoA synthetase (AMP-forming)